MGARLAAAVHIQHPATREPLMLQPGEEPEPEVAELMTNPDAWEGGLLPALPVEPDAARGSGPQAVTEPAQEPSRATVDTPKPEPAPSPTAAPRTRTRKTAPE